MGFWKKMKTGLIHFMGDLTDEEMEEEVKRLNKKVRENMYEFKEYNEYFNNYLGELASNCNMGFCAVDGGTNDASTDSAYIGLAPRGNSQSYTVSQGRTVDQGKHIYEGYNRNGLIRYTIKGNRIYEGINTDGRVLYTIQGNRIFEGYDTNGPIKYTIQGNKIYEGMMPSGLPLYNIEGNRIYEGLYPNSMPLFNA